MSAILVYSGLRGPIREEGCTCEFVQMGTEWERSYCWWCPVHGRGPSVKRDMVLGFVFDEKGYFTLLIRKNKPAFLAGMWNGLGGKIEDEDAGSKDAIAREVEEEAGVVIPRKEWSVFGMMHEHGSHKVHLLRAFVPWKVLEAAEMKETEELTITPIDRAVSTLNVVPNLRWLIPLALDKTVNNADIMYQKGYLSSKSSPDVEITISEENPRKPKKWTTIDEFYEAPSDKE